MKYSLFLYYFGLYNALSKSSLISLRSSFWIRLVKYQKLLICCFLKKDFLKKKDCPKQQCEALWLYCFKQILSFLCLYYT